MPLVLFSGVRSDKKYLDLQLWHDLEYGITRPSKTVEPPQPPRSTPRLARAIRGAMSEKDFWEGTASELLSMIGLGKEGIPKDSTRLAAEVMKPHITDALKPYGLTVHRRRTGGRRLLQLSNITR